MSYLNSNSTVAGLPIATYEELAPIMEEYAIKENLDTLLSDMIVNDLGSEEDKVTSQLHASSVIDTLVDAANVPCTVTGLLEVSQIAQNTRTTDDNSFDEDGCLITGSEYPLYPSTNNSLTDIMSQLAITKHLAQKVGVEDLVYGSGLSKNVTMSQDTFTSLLENKIESSTIVQKEGSSPIVPMSQKAITDALNKAALEVERTPVSDTLGRSINVTIDQEVVSRELILKLNINRITQESGSSRSLVMSQKKATSMIDGIVGNHTVVKALPELGSSMKDTISQNGFTTGIESFVRDSSVYVETFGTSYIFDVVSGNATEGDYRSPTGYALTGLLYNTSGALSKIICNKIKVTKYAIQ